MRFTFFCFLFLSFYCFAAYAQQDTRPLKINDSVNLHHKRTISAFSPDSAALAKVSRQLFIEDSLAMVYLRPDSQRMDRYIDSIRKNKLSGFRLPAAGAYLKQKRSLSTGQVRNSRDPWVILVVVALLIFTALLNVVLNKDIKTVLHSFYNEHAISQVDREGGLINSWAFVGLFLLFSLTLGLILYQVTVYYNVVYTISGFKLFMTLSVEISLLLALKFVILKFVGFVFDINRQISEYISVLNLTYFNMAFVLLFVVVCFCLLASRYIPSLLIFTLVAVVVIFAWQYLRKSVNIISDFRLHKFYLFIYLCALEICPVLILIKVLNI